MRWTQSLYIKFRQNKSEISIETDAKTSKKKIKALRGNDFSKVPHPDLFFSDIKFPH